MRDEADATLQILRAEQTREG
jgi:hypothetical protein